MHSFSYPFGSRRDFSAETVRLVGAAGFDVACANYFGTVCRSTDRYKLPRMLVRNWNGDEFAWHLDMTSAG